MNNFDDWSQIISKYLKSEADPLGSLTKHELEGDAARIAFIRSVLDRFLPEIYGVGSGQIMDSKGNLSGKLDIIIYRRDFPRLDLPGSRDIYLYESVIATVEVVAKLVKKTFFDALNQCALLADLNPDIDQKVMTGLAARNQLTLNENRQYVHPDPIRTARFNLIGRPLSFIYAFSGYKTSPNQLAETMQAWMKERRDNHQPVEMKALPSVVATQGCFAWRNSAPFTVNEHSLMGVGVDQAPVRLIVLQMLHTLSRRLKMTTDGYGLKPGLDGYLNRMPPPEMKIFIGKARNPSIGEEVASSNLTQNSQPAVKVAPKSASIKPVTAGPDTAKASAPKPAVAKQAETKPVAEKPAVVTPSKASAPAVNPEAAKAVPTAKPAEVKPAAVSKPAAVPSAPMASKPAFDSAKKPEIEIKTRPSASSPAIDRAAASKPLEKPAANSLASLSPKPEAVDAPFPVPNADLIPKLDPNPPGTEEAEDESESSPFGKLEDPAVLSKEAEKEAEQKPVAKKPALNAVPKSKPTAVDFELSPSAAKSEKPDVATVVDSADNFMETMKMKLAVPESKKKTNSTSSSSAEDFMETVKMQLSSSEPFPHLQPESEPKPEPFTSTIPQ